MCTIIVLYVMIVKSFRYKDFGSVLYINEMMMMVVSSVFHVHVEKSMLDLYKRQLYMYVRTYI